MKRIALKFGLIAGAILGGMIVVTMPLYRRGVIDFDNGEIIGFSSVVLAFLLVFFGIRSYREEVGGGTIGFWKAVRVGLLITLVACTVYVLTWQVVYFGFFPDFLDQYNAHTIAEMRAEGESAAKIAAKQAQMAKLAKLYKNPLFNAGVTYLEVFPLGLVP